MTYLVGYRPHKDDKSALELACQLARSMPNTIHALTVVPRGWETAAGSHTDRDFVAWAEQEGEASAAEAEAFLRAQEDVSSTATWVTGRSVPAAVLEQAIALEAALIVVGSGPDGPDGRVTVTSKTGRLLHSSTVPVVIAPRGYRPEPGSKITRATIAFRDDDLTWRLLDQVAEICRQVGTRVRLLTVALRQASMVTSPVRAAEAVVFDELLQQVNGAQVDAVSHLEGLGFDPEPLVASGTSWAEAMATVSWDPGDVLVVGSSSTHQLANVFLGSSAGKIVRNSPVPVVVVP